MQTKRDAVQTYALYLPSNYTPARRWPILYCFDPMARGRLPVERFRAAAEQYGWVVVGSNNSRNGPLKQALDAVNAVWEDTHARLSIDDRRVYSAGFSGGARVAVRLNYLCRDCLAGVVAIGGGFPADIAPGRSTPFALFAAAGTDDFNFPELKLLAATFAKLRLPHRLALFAGNHAWPPAETCAEAVEWMEVQALRSGRRASDESLVKQLWQKFSDRALAAEKSGDAYKAYGDYLALAEGFEGLRDTRDAAAKARVLSETKAIADAREEEEAQVRRQQKLARELAALAGARRDPDRGALAWSEFKRTVGRLRKAARSEVDGGERRVARRVLREVFARHFEPAAIIVCTRGESNAGVIADLEVAAELAPEDAHVQYELARALALNRERKRALEVLRRAVGQGFRDKHTLASDAAFAALRDDPVFRSILNNLNSER